MTNFEILEMYSKQRIPAFGKVSSGYWIMCEDTACEECKCHNVCSTNGVYNSFTLPKFSVEEVTQIRESHPEWFL